MKNDSKNTPTKVGVLIFLFVLIIARINYVTTNGAEANGRLVSWLPSTFVTHNFLNNFSFGSTINTEACIRLILVTTRTLPLVNRIIYRLFTAAVFTEHDITSVCFYMVTQMMR